MARFRTLSELRSMVWERSDTDSDYIGQAELDRMINLGLAELYTLMVKSSKDWFLDSHDVSVVAGTTNYALADDHFKALKVVVQDGGDWYPMRKWSLHELSSLQNSGATSRRSGYRIQNERLYIYPVDFNWSATVRVWYAPAPPELTDPEDTWNGAAGWEEYVVLDCCMKIAIKQEEDEKPWRRLKADQYQRVIDEASEGNDSSEPDRIRDTLAESFGLDYTDFP